MILFVIYKKTRCTRVAYDKMRRCVSAGAVRELACVMVLRGEVQRRARVAPRYVSHCLLRGSV